MAAGKNLLRFMIIGDVIGEPGLQLCKKWVPILKDKHRVDAVIINGENAAKDGKGINVADIDFLKACGATIITTGNHAWDQKNVYAALKERDDVIRPINYPAACPGKGYALFFARDIRCAVVNLHGRAFINDVLDCPFKAIESLLTFLRTKTDIILVDFHGEATSEKKTMGMFLDGRVSGVWGTHTHVQTADEMILPGGTSFITDVGSCGALYSVIGFEFKQVLQRFLIHHKFGKFIVEENGPMVLSGMIIEVDAETGKTVRVERIRVVDHDIKIHSSLK